MEKLFGETIITHILYRSMSVHTLTRCCNIKEQSNALVEGSDDRFNFSETESRKLK